MPCRDPGIAAEDLAAETWLTAATKIADFKGTSDDFAGWIFGIARMQRRNAERRTTRRRTTPAPLESLETSATLHASAAGATPETDHWIAWLLTHLPERERQVIACIEVVGLDVATTAAALRLSPGNVRVLHHRALKRLRTLGPHLT